MEIAGFRSKYSDEQIEALLDAAANGGGGGGEWKYYDASSLSSQMAAGVIQSFGHVAKVQYNNKTIIGSGVFAAMMDAGGVLCAIGCNTSAYYCNPDSGYPLMKISEILSMDVGGIPYEQMLISKIGLIPISEEEFLNLNA